MKFTNEEYEKLYKKLEYTFKKSGHDLVKKIENKESLNEDDLKLLVRKMEYTFRKSGDELMNKLVELSGEPAQKYSNLKAKKTKDARKEVEKEIEEEKKKLKHLKEWNEFYNDK